MEEVKIRFITYNKSYYLRVEDVVKYLLEFADGEETDVRNRLEEAAKSIHDGFLATRENIYE